MIGISEKIQCSNTEKLSLNQKYTVLFCKLSYKHNIDYSILFIEFYRIFIQIHYFRFRLSTIKMESLEQFLRSQSSELLRKPKLSWNSVLLSWNHFHSAITMGGGGGARENKKPLCITYANHCKILSLLQHLSNGCEGGGQAIPEHWCCACKQLMRQSCWLIKEPLSSNLKAFINLFHRFFLKYHSSVLTPSSPNTIL